MKAATVVGVLPIVLGIADFAMSGVSFPMREKMSTSGRCKWHQQKSTRPISPVLSTFSFVIGAGLVVVAVRSHRCNAVGDSDDRSPLLDAPGATRRTNF